jgi:hypothetical protein
LALSITFRKAVPLRIEVTLYCRHKTGFVAMAPFAPVNFYFFPGRQGGRASCRNFLLASLAFLTLVLVNGDWLLSLYPRYGVQIGGALAEATVVEMVTPYYVETSREKGVWANVAFTPECQKAPAAGCPEVRTTITLPEEVAEETVTGAHIPIVYLPAKPDYAVYAIVTNHVFVPDAATIAVIFAAIAEFLFCVTRPWAGVESFRRLHGEAPFFVAAIFAVMVALLCFYMTSHLLKWELGMAHAKRSSPSEITELAIRNGAYNAKYSFVTENGQRVFRSRQFNFSEIDDVRKMKVGRKFDVVYIAGKPMYNRPDWVEQIHAPRRKSWMLLWFLAGFGVLFFAIWSFDWARPRFPP